MAGKSISDKDPKRLYATLGVATDAEVSEIRKAYRRLALKWHPDKNQDNPSATSEFQKISAAYEVLSDESRREMYDTTGCLDKEELEERMDPHDLFASFFGNLFGEEDMDLEEQAMFDEFLKFSGGSAFRRKGARGKKNGKSSRSAKAAGPFGRGSSSMEGDLLEMMMGLGGGGAEMEEPVCPKGHNLKRKKADAEYSCDLCEKDIHEGKRIFECKKCDYSLCQGCHKKQAEDLAMCEDEDEHNEEELLELFGELSCEPVREGARMMFQCEYCKTKLATQEKVQEHMKARHREEFEAFVEHISENGMGGAGMMGGMAGGQSLEEMLLADMLGGQMGGMMFDIDGLDKPKGSKSKKKKR